jgi:ribosome biogenesis GTPase A
MLQVSKAAQKFSKDINDRRRARGLKPRPVRAVVIGFPNVGKSALINRLLNKRVCQSAPKPGVTRQLKWVKMDADLDLLDAPGGLLFPYLCAC